MAEEAGRGQSMSEEATDNGNFLSFPQTLWVFKKLTAMWFFSGNDDFNSFESQNGYSWDQCRPPTDLSPLFPSSANHIPE